MPKPLDFRIDRVATPVGELLIVADAEGRLRTIDWTDHDARMRRLLDRYYDEWLSEFNHCPVLTIRSDDLDFVHRKKDLGVVVQRIEDRLTGREEVVFQ